MKSTQEESGKCKTFIEINQGRQIFISDAHEWISPEKRYDKTEFEVYAGWGQNNKGFKAAIRNVTITSYESYLEPSKKKINLKIIERCSNDGTFDISRQKAIGKIKSITPNMEFSFELKIENMDSCRVDDYNRVLSIGGWFYFDIKKSTEKSKFYVYHAQQNGCQLGCHDDICKQNPITFTNNWQKEFLSKILMTKSCLSNIVFSILF